MINDVLYDPTFFVFEVPDEISGGTISAVSFDGDNYLYSQTGGNNEIISVFVN